jgi:glutamine amidotransferase
MSWMDQVLAQASGANAGAEGDFAPAALEPQGGPSSSLDVGSLAALAPAPERRPAPVAVLDSGVSNLASILAALARAGVAAQPVRSPAALREAQRLVLPGVGSFAAAMAALQALGLVEVLRERLLAGRATLAICLGLQLLAEQSAESPGVAGLGVWPLSVERFPVGVAVPQLGWNPIRAEAGCRFLESGYACFANSYRLDAVPAGWRAAFADHGGPFVAALERGDVLACQFHPELSGAFGARLIARWLAATEPDRSGASPGRLVDAALRREPRP